MFKNIIAVLLIAATSVAGFSGCKKETYQFGELKAPADLVLTTTVVGANTANPNGDGSGSVVISASSKNALGYSIDFGDGTTKMVPSGATTYKFSSPGTKTYTVTVNAIGTGGSMSTISKQVTVFVAFEIPADILAAFTGGSSKTWVTDKEANGHFGVGPADQFAPIWYEAGPNSREACAYDDEITFALGANNTITMSIDNKGTSFSTGAATGFYGFSGGDGCYAISTTATQPLSFANATSGSTTAVSTGIQFSVPGKGIINFGTGGTVYEIIRYTANTMFLRNIGADGNAWYQKLIAK
ncbi:PKD domain-containing protein [Pseudocnuella soli]|uniref:PKD domain-containing protein n=1 Tax=Pseudocnuella soli TaxID=2502779 RepID=UPI00104721E2|nr:PKD domain-containing protein [Pseudocnuella soli]